MDVFIGGGGDSISRIVASYRDAFAAEHPGRRTFYFRRGQRRAALHAIIAARASTQGEPVHLIGHSYGAAVAVALSRSLAVRGIEVDLLITIDPVGRYWTRRPGAAREWINVCATPASFNGFDGDAWALLGGKWGAWPEGRATSCHVAPFHHNEFSGLLEFAPPDGESALQRLLRKPRAPRSR